MVTRREWAEVTGLRSEVWQPVTRGADQNAVTWPERLEIPFHWWAPRAVITCTAGDLFHALVPDAFLDRVFAVMALASYHEFAILTEQPARMRDYIRSRNGWCDGVWKAAQEIRPERPPAHWYHAARTLPWPLRNVWLGTSVEDQRNVLFRGTSARALRAPTTRSGTASTASTTDVLRAAGAGGGR